MDREDLIPPTSDAEKANGTIRRTWRWVVGGILGAGIAMIGWFLTRHWEWFLAIPLCALMIARSKLRFPATWLNG